MKSLLAVILVALCPAFASAAEKTVVRIGHFPNVTHAQALVAHNLSRQGKGWFEERLGPEVEVRWFVFNAGPSAMESLLAGSLDVTYVGPNPALNAHIRSRGDEVRIVAGAANGGAALVVQSDGRISVPADFRGKKIATPQLGNTQDVACRSWLAAQGFKITQLGGDAQVLPTANPDQLALFQRKKIDAVWTVEPWVSRLEMEAGGKIFIEDKESVTTVLACSARFLEKRRDLAKKITQAHAELTDWINRNPGEAQRLVRDELTAEMRREFPLALIEHAWPRLQFTSAVTLEPLERFVADARKVGFLREKVDLNRLLETP